MGLAAALLLPSPAGAQANAGLFFNEQTGDPMRIGVDNGRLRIQGGPPLDAIAKGRFRNPRSSLQFMSQDAFELQFVSNDPIELKSKR